MDQRRYTGPLANWCVQSLTVNTDANVTALSESPDVLTYIR